MDYSVEYIPAVCQDRIEKDWRRLETGNEMTLFQSYDWYKMLIDFYVPKDTKHYESVFALVKKAETICIIAPLWIIKKNFRFINKKGVYLLGRDSYSDYLNFIYNSFDSKAFDYLINDIHIRFNLNHFIFEQINENSTIIKYITSSFKIINCKKDPCVNLHLPTSRDGYNKLLSKHARQNLRTANNRLTKDGLSITIDVDNIEVDKKKCLLIRESKLSIQYNKVSSIKKYKYRIINKYRFHFPKFSPITDYTGSKVMTATINKELCAFFNYAFDKVHKKVVIISAGTNIQYARYSPGILLMYAFIMKTIENNYYSEIDFTRGDEKYKYVLGGETNYNYSIHFSVK